MDPIAINLLSGENEIEFTLLSSLIKTLVKFVKSVILTVPSADPDAINLLSDEKTTDETQLK